MSRRPRLLFLSQRFLFPLNEGGRIRTANILREMKGGAFEIVLASPAGASPAEASPGGPERHRDEVAAICDRHATWTEAPVRTWQRALMLPGRLPVSVAAGNRWAARAAMAKELTLAPDLVVVDFPHAAILVPPDLPAPNRPASVLFTHNVEAEIYARHARLASGPMRLIWKDQARKMRRFEQAALARFDTAIAVSRRDATALAEAYGPRRIDVIDTGVDLAFHTPGPAPAPPPPDGGTLVFTGAMDWPANAEGIDFLLEAVWPHLVRARPRLRAVIVGRKPPQGLAERARARGADWTVTGFVDDVRPYVAGAHVYVIPLRVGSGTRIKAFEAMAAGRPVVSTAVGIEGLPVVPEEHFLLADAPEAFARQVLRLLDDGDLRTRIAGAARSLVEARFSWAHVARQFEAICLGTLERRRASPTRL